MIDLENPIEKINFIKEKTSEVITENNLSSLDVNLDDLFIVYSADLCTMLLNFFPAATIMMNKNFRCCAIMIQGNVYDSYGITNKANYFIAEKEDVDFIKKSLPQISDEVISKINEKLLIEQPRKFGSSFTLRKNSQSAT